MGLKGNKKKIGDIAVDKLSDALNLCERLDPKFRKNDTHLSWDGEIEYHCVEEGGAFSAKSYRGSCLVQIKGTVVNEEILLSSTIKHKVYLTDIENFDYSGGTIFFVVALVESEDYIKSKIFYKVFLPFDIKNMLADFKNKQKTIVFDEFPESRTEKEQIVYEFILDKERQIGTSRSIGTFLESSNHSEYIFWVSSNNGNPFFDQRPKYLYKILSKEVFQPVGKFVIKEAKLNSITFPVFIDNKLIFNNAKVIIDAKDNLITRIEINRGLELGSFSTKRKKGNFILNDRCSFLDYAKNLEFLKLLYQGGHLKIGDLLEGDYSKTELSFDHIDEIISYYKDIDKLLVGLNIKSSIRLNKFNRTDIEKLHYLYECVILKKPYHKKLSAVCFDKIGSLTLFVLILTENDIPRIYNAFSLPKGDVEMSFDKNSPRFKSSLYVRLNAEQYLTLDNLDTEIIKKSMTNVPYSDYYGTMLNLSILEMLKAFDKKHSDDILDCVLTVSKWLYEQEIENDTFFINYMQSVRRKRKFNDNEIKAIVERKNKCCSKNPQNILILAGISALLSNSIEVKFYIDLMDETERQNFYDLPIIKVLSF